MLTAIIFTFAFGMFLGHYCFKQRLKKLVLTMSALEFVEYVKWLVL